MKKQLLFNTKNFYILLIISATSFTNISFSKNLFYGAGKDFISRWSFQKACKFWFDLRKGDRRICTFNHSVTFNPKEVKAGDIVFVRHINDYFNKMHSKIKSPYIIVTHGDFRSSFERNFKRYIEDKKIVAWFGIHPLIEHPKFFPIPIGVTQLNRDIYNKRSYINGLFKHLRDNSVHKKLLLINFSYHGKKPDRNRIMTILSNSHFTTKATHKPFYDYLKEMSEHKFTLSPTGRGPDAYRTWEALLSGSIPIVKNTPYLNPLYKDLPILIVDRWEQITPRFLEVKYQQITSKKYNINKLYVEYWMQKINDIKKQFLKNIN